MPTIRLTQEQNEQEMLDNGREKMRAMFTAAEEGGRADNNPYASRVYGDFVLPLAARIRQELSNPTPGQAHAHVQLLQPLDPDAVAFLVVRTVLVSCLAGPQNHRALGYSVGRTVHRELVLAQIEVESPELYHTLARDFARRKSTDERHRLTVFRMQAEKAGIDFVEWSVGARDQVGLYFMKELEELGLIDIGPETRKQGYKREYRDVGLTEQVMTLLSRVKDYLMETSPTYGPCVEPPKDWTNHYNGGFYTKQMRRAAGPLIKCARSARPWVEAQDCSNLFRTINTLQQVPWQVNAKVLETIDALVAANIPFGEVTSAVHDPAPEKPDFLATKKSNELSPEEALIFRKWKRAMSQWYEAKKLHRTKYGRMYTATRQARRFVDYPAIYFVYFADSRGRVYPHTYGLSPQGSDLQKALIRFSRGLPIDSPHAQRWFLVQGANKWGFDKATLDERAAWVRERHDMIVSFADDPVGNRGWTSADAPLQFLAWCFEYARWQREGSEFLSHLPISMDGSCNGLQHFSAMLRDEVGGEATNLRNLPVMQDIYMRVALQALKNLKALKVDPDKQSLLDRWKEHGVVRSLVKRSVMTTPYGVTKRSAAVYVIKDYLEVYANPFEPVEYQDAANLIMDAIWPAIGEVVIKARAAMDWLKTAGRVIAKEVEKDADPIISWVTPSGFPATQAYYEENIHRIRTRLHGAARIRVVTETDTPSTTRHSSGLAPNFVHSMDASHLHLAVLRAASEGVTDFAMIHDDYGTHAHNAQQLFWIIRDTFVEMYEKHAPLAALRDKYPVLKPPPLPGNLDIREVLYSDFFFS